MKTNQKYDPELIDRAIQDYLDSGLSQVQIAREYGINESTFKRFWNQYRKDHGIERWANYKR